MLATLLRLFGFDLRTQVRQITIMAVLALAGAAAALMTFVIAVAAFYLWLERELGTFPALGILGVITAMAAAILFLLAFARGNRKTGTRSAFLSGSAGQDRLAHETADRLAMASEEAADATEDFFRHGSRQSILGVILVAAAVGWLIGRRV